jgi:hypothetical protein
MLHARSCLGRDRQAAWRRRRLAAAAGGGICVQLLLAGAAFGAPGERCWGLTTTEEFTPYAVPYPYGSSDGAGYNIPDCRYGYLGIPDRTDYDSKKRLSRSS